MCADADKHESLCECISESSQYLSKINVVSCLSPRTLFNTSMLIIVWRRNDAPAMRPASQSRPSKSQAPRSRSRSNSHVLPLRFSCRQNHLFQTYMHAVDFYALSGRNVCFSLLSFLNMNPPNPADSVHSMYHLESSKSCNTNLPKSHCRMCSLLPAPAKGQNQTAFLLDFSRNDHPLQSRCQKHAAAFVAQTAPPPWHSSLHLARPKIFSSGRNQPIFPFFISPHLQFRVQGGFQFFAGKSVCLSPVGCDTDALIAEGL